MIALRPYQEELIFGQLYNKLAEGAQRVVTVSATGSGKTVAACQIIKDLVEEGCACLFVCHLDQLVIQTGEKLALYGINSDLIGYITGGRKEHRERPIQVASIQSLERRSWWKDRVWGGIILDECHLTAFRKSSAYFFSEAHEGVTIGLTATPYRLKKTEALGDWFEALVQAPTPAQLTEMGALAPLRYYGFGSGAIDTKGVGIRGGEFVQVDLELASTKPEMLRHAVAQWKRLASDRKTLAFCVTIRHALALRDAFREAGIPADTVHGDTPREERQALYRQLADGRISVLTSCEVLSIGFDLPCADALLLCRPTKSRANHLQQLGRGARPSPGKVDCLVLDQAGNVLRPGLGFLADDGPWSLKPSQDAGPGGEAPTKECPTDEKDKHGREGCGCIVHASLMECPDCGFKFKPKKKNSRTDDLQELKAQPKLTAPHRKMQGLLRQANRRTYLPSWAGMRFQEEYGYEPPTEFYRHALYPEPSPEAIGTYTTYLALLMRAKDRPFGVALTALTREFGAELITAYLPQIRETYAEAQANTAIQAESFIAPSCRATAQAFSAA